MVAFNDDDQDMAADLAVLVENRYPMPDMYTQYFIDTLLELLQLDSPAQLKKFFERLHPGADILVVSLSKEAPESPAAPG